MKDAIQPSIEPFADNGEIVQHQQYADKPHGKADPIGSGVTRSPRKRLAMVDVKIG